MTLILTGRTLTIEDVARLRRGGKVALASSALARARRSRTALERGASRRVIYGVNTGFGPMASERIALGDLEALQVNLVRSHASGGGEPLPLEQVRATLLVRLNTLLRGDSGVSEALLRHMAACFNADILPVVPEHGGVGASGDLVQLSHLALGLIGEGEVYARGRRMRARAALKQARLEPYRLKMKEGLALINGTSMMTGMGALVVHDARRLVSAALRTSALSMEATHALSDAIDPALHRMRPHAGQERVARALRALTRGSKLLRSRVEAERTSNDLFQDVYSIRCAPQIIGPTLETLEAAERVLAIELNSATDNPLVEGRRFLHGGNFHGEYVAAALDSLKAALAKLGMLEERRINYFLNSALNRRFPPFLNLKRPGLTLALQGLQFTATSIAAESQSLSFPHALHSISTNADNQDVVSMGSDAARLAGRVLENGYLVAGIELIALAQAIDCSEDARKLSGEGKKLYRFIRASVKAVREDRPLAKDLARLSRALIEEKKLELAI